MSIILEFFSFNSYVLDFGLEGGVLGLGLGRRGLGLGLGLEVCVLGLALALGVMSLLTSLVWVHRYKKIQTLISDASAHYTLRLCYPCD